MPYLVSHASYHIYDLATKEDIFSFHLAFQMITELSVQ